MEEDERKSKLRAGKEKLAQFQKKKKKKPSDAVPASEAHAAENVSPTMEDLAPTTEVLALTKETDMDMAQPLSAGTSLVDDLPSAHEENVPDATVPSIKSSTHDEIQAQSASAVSLPKDLPGDAGSQSIAGNQSQAAGTQPDVRDTGAGQQQVLSTEEIQELSRHVQWLQLQLKQAGSTLQDQNEKQKSTLSALHNAKKEILSLQDSMIEKDQLMTKVTDRLKQMSTEYCSLKSLYTDQVKQSSSNPENMEKFQREVIDLKMKMNDEHSKLLNSLNEANRKEIHDLKQNHQSEIDKLRSELHAKVAELESANTNLVLEKSLLIEKGEKDANVQEQLELSNKSMIEERDNLKIDCEKYSALEQELRVEIEHWKTQTGNLSAENQTLRDDVDVLKQEKDMKNSEIKHLSDQISDLRNSKQTLENQLSELQVEIDAFRSENDKITNDKDNLNEELLQVQEENATYQSQISEYEDKISQTGDLMEENHLLRVQNDELYNKINNQKDIIATLKCDIDTMSCENSKLVDQLSEMSACSEQFKNDRGDWMKENENLHSALNDLKNQLNVAQTDNVNMGATNVVTNEEIQYLQQFEDNLASEILREQNIVDLAVAQEWAIPHGGLIEESEMVAEHLSVTQCREKDIDDDKVQSDNAALQELSVESHVSADLLCSLDNVEDTDISPVVKKTVDICDKAAETVYVPFIETAMQTENDQDLEKDTKISELQQEVERLTLELRENGIQTFDHANSHHFDPSNENTFESTISDDKACLDHTEDDTAYHSVDSSSDATCQNELSDLDDRENAGNLAALHLDLQRTKEQLHRKTQECSQLRKKIDDFVINEETQGVRYVKQDCSNESDACVSGDSEVSDLNIGRIVASELEVNLHASSAPMCDGVSDLLSNDSVEGVPFVHSVVIDNGAQNQNFMTDSNMVDSEHNSSNFALKLAEIESLKQELHGVNEESKRYKKEIEYLKELAEISKQERDDLLNFIQLEKSEKETVVEELEEREELDRKFAKEAENQNTALEALNKKVTETEVLLKCMESQNNELKCENEKLEWERDEFELKSNEQEKEILDIKTAKCDVEFNELQLKEELKGVKDRLDYLESSEKDFFEMRELLEKIQEEKDKIVQENERLQCTLSMHVEENDKLFETMEALHSENATALDSVKVSRMECLRFEKELEKCKLEENKFEKKIAHIKKKLESTESKFVGELEGLLEENSTLKTKVQSKDAEIEMIHAELEAIRGDQANSDECSESLDVLKKENSDLHLKCKDLSDENEHIVVELLDFQHKLVDVTNENEILLDKCEEFQNVVSELDDEKTLLLENNKKIDVEMAKKSKELEMCSEKYELQLDGLVEENATLKTHVSSLKQDLQEVLDQVQTIDEEYAKKVELVSQVEEENKDLKDEISDYKSKMSGLEEDLLGLVEQVQVYDDTLTEKSDLASRLENEMKSLLEENNTLKEKCDSLEHDLHEVKETNTYQTDQLKIFEESANSSDIKSSQIERLESQMELEIRYKKKFQKDVEDAQKELSRSEMENQNLNDTIENLQRKLNHIEDDRNLNKSTIEKLSEELKNVTNEKDKVRSDLQNVETEKKELLKHNSKLNNELTTMHAHLHAVSENRNHIRTQVEMLAAEIESLTNARDDITSRYFSARKEKQSLKDNCRRMNEIIDSLNEECISLQMEKTELEKAYLIAKEDKESGIAEACNEKERNLTLKNENEALNETLQEMYVRVKEIKTQKEELEVSTKELTNMLHDMQTKYEEVKSDMEGTKKKCDKEIFQLQSQLQIMNEDVTELKTMLDFMENEMHKAAEEKSVLKENLEQQQVQYVETIEQKQKLEEICQKQQKDRKNMEMVSRLNQRVSPTSSSESFVSSVNDTPVNVSHVQISASSQEPVEQFNSTMGRSERQDDTMCFAAESDDKPVTLVPSFEHAFQFMNLSEPSDLVSSTFVQTNLSIGEFESLGHLVDDNGQHTENVKDVSKTDSQVQTEDYKREDIGMDGARQVLHEVDDTFVNQNNSVFVTESEQESEIVCNIDQAEASTSVQHMHFSDQSSQTDGGGSSDIKTVLHSSCQTELVRRISTSCQCDSFELKSEMLQREHTQLSLTTLDAVDIVPDILSDSQAMESVCDDTGDSAVVNKSTEISQILNDCLTENSAFENHNRESSEKCEDNVHSEDTTELNEKYDNENREVVKSCDESVTITTVECQTEPYSYDDEIDELVQQKLAERSEDIEETVIDLEYRERKLKASEDNYDKKIKQLEYDIEERFEQKFRYREAEIVVEAEKDKKQFATDVEQAANQRVEQIKIEKDRQFVETLQKVRKDMAKRQKSRTSDESPKRVDSQQSEPGEDRDDVEADQPRRADLAKLKKDNKELALARDALLQKIDLSYQEHDYFHQELVDIMGEQSIMGNPEQQSSSAIPSWLDWEISPEFSFDSVTSSLDTKSLSGSLDVSAFCTNSNCHSMRMKYEHLVEKIQHFLKNKYSQQLSTSTSAGNFERDDVDDDNGSEINIEMERNEEVIKVLPKDRFVEHDEPDSQILERLTSIHLEHFMRLPESTESPATGDDQFISEGNEMRPVLQQSDADINNDIIDCLVKMSGNDDVKRNESVEGVFSENESESEDDMVHGLHSSLTAPSYENQMKKTKSTSSRNNQNMQTVGQHIGWNRRRHFSESDVKFSPEGNSNVKTSQSDNAEGHFVFERSLSQSEFDAENIDATKFVIEQNSGEDDVFNGEVVYDSSDAYPIVEGIQAFSDNDKDDDDTCSQSTDRFIVDMPQRDEPPGSVNHVSVLGETEAHTGEESGHFFQENVERSIVIRPLSAQLPVQNSDNAKELEDTEFTREDVNFDRFIAEGVPATVNLPLSPNTTFRTSQTLHKRAKSADLSWERITAFSDTRFFTMENEELVEDRIDSGDILETLSCGKHSDIITGRAEQCVDGAGDRMSQSFSGGFGTIDGRFQNKLKQRWKSDTSISDLPRDENESKSEVSEQFVKEEAQNSSSSPRKTLTKGQPGYENAVFDILNSICPGTDPKRIPRLEAGESMFRPQSSLGDTEKARTIAHEGKQEAQQDCVSLQAEIERLSREKEALEKDLKELSDIAKSKSSENEKVIELEKENLVLHSRCTELSEKLKQIGTDPFSLGNTTDKADDLQGEVPDPLCQASSETCQTNISTDDKISVCEIDETHIQDDDKVSDRIKTLEDQLSELKETKGALIAQNEQLLETADRFSELNHAQESLKCHIANLENDKDKISNQLIFEKETNQLQKVELENALLAQADMYEQLEKEHKVCKEGLEALKDYEELKSHLSKMDAENEILKAALTEEKENNKMQQNLQKDMNLEISCLKKSKDDINQIMTTLNSDLETANNELIRKTEEIMCLKSEKELINNRIVKLENQTKEFQSSLSDKEETIKCIIAEKDQLIQEIKCLENKNEALRKDLVDHENQISNICQEEKMSNTESEYMKKLQTENIELKKSVEEVKERNDENEWALKELGSQNEALEAENDSLKKDVETTAQKLCSCQDKLSEINQEVNQLKKTNVLFKEKLENVDAKSESNQNNVQEFDQSNVQDTKDTENSRQKEKSSLELPSSSHSEQLVKENKRLQSEIEFLHSENKKLEKQSLIQRENLKRENLDILKMYNDLRSEVEVLVISKHDLEVELHALKDLLEQETDSVHLKCDHDTSRELTIDDLEEMEDLKDSIERLKSDMKEKDSYVRKLEEHLLNLDRGLPDFTSAPKPALSSGVPAVSKTVVHRRQHWVEFGRQAYSHELPSPVMNIPDEETSDKFINKVDLDLSSVSENQFVRGLHGELEVSTNSMLSDTPTISSTAGSFDGNDRVKSGLTPEEDGHVALEMKQYELVDEISKLRRDFRETKAIYRQETALLTEALEKEKISNELKKSGQGSLRSQSLTGFPAIPQDMLRLRQDLAVLQEENKLLKIENERWTKRLKEQEVIVLDLKDRLSRNTSGIEEIEEVFGRQLALLQKQREELLDKLRDREVANSKLSVKLGEKSVIEETLRREKDILIAKLQEKEDIESDLNERRLVYEKQVIKQKHLEEVIYQKDLHERELMRQKRLLEEEIHEIESKFKEREEDLGFEKNKLLSELKEKGSVKNKSDLLEYDDDKQSLCSDKSTSSERNIARLETTLEEVEKQHAAAVRVLRDQLSAKYSRREKKLKEEHSLGLSSLRQNANKQV